MKTTDHKFSVICENSVKNTGAGIFVKPPYAFPAVALT